MLRYVQQPVALVCLSLMYRRPIGDLLLEKLPDAAGKEKAILE